MTVREVLIGRIYEAAVAPDGWPEILRLIAEEQQARGAVIFSISPRGVDWVASPDLERDAADYFDQGWASDPERIGFLFDELYPGFRCELDYRTAEQIDRLPVYREFLTPRGYRGGCGTLIQGPVDKIINVSLEGFASHEAAARSLPWLEQLRPHLGRALGLSTLLGRDRHVSMVEALRLAGLGAAIVDSNGRLSASNSLFIDKLGNRMVERRGGLWFTAPFLDKQYRTALARLRSGLATVQSVAVGVADDSPPVVVHLLPIAGKARDFCNSDGVLLLAGGGANAALPGADVLRVLFDLTPAEAQLARRLMEGKTIAAAAAAAGTSVETARTHLRRVFAKTGVGRQVDLVRLLLGLQVAGDESVR